MKYNEVELSDHIIGMDKLIIKAMEERRSIDVTTVVKYGIPAIDRFLWGILPSELVIISAETGKWKTEFAMNIAITNAERWKKVLLLALEGDMSEIPLRYLQQKMSDMFPQQKIKTVDYRFNTDPILRDVEDVAYENIPDAILENIKFYNKVNIPDLQTVKDVIMSSRDYFDVFVLDHINYVQYEGESETRALWDIMRELKTVTDIIKKPIVLMSHVRKKQNGKDNSRELTNDDLYGSSNISKEATTIIFVMHMDLNEIPKCWYLVDDGKRYSGTKISVTKSRIWLPPLKLWMVYDRFWKKYKDEYASVLDDSIATEADAFTNFI